MKVLLQVGRGGRNAASVERPVRVHQHCNDWAAVDYLDVAGGHDTVSITALIMESEVDLAMFNPGLGGHGALWDEFKLAIRRADGEPTTWGFVPRVERPKRPARRRRA